MAKLKSREAAEKASGEKAEKEKQNSEKRRAYKGSPARILEHGDTGDVETNVAIVRTGQVNSGDPTYQAEIFVPQGGRDAVNHSGRPRVMCIRGPSRTSKEQALEDAAKLSEAASDDPKSVRAVANQMLQLQRAKKAENR